MSRVWFVRGLSIRIGPLLLAFAVHLYVGRRTWLDAVDDIFAFVGADFHAVFSRCFLKSLSTLLQLFSSSEHIDVIGKPQVTKRSASSGH